MEAAGNRYILHRSRSDWFSIWNLSDVHYLARACAESHFKADIKRIARDPRALWIAGGDLFDFVNYKDKKRFNAANLAPWVTVKMLANLGNVAVERMSALLAPIRGKCLGIMQGNHETAYESRCDTYYTAALCENLDVPFLGYSCMMRLVFCRTSSVKKPVLQLTQCPRGNSHMNSFCFFAHHGAGAAQTAGGKVNRLVRFMGSFDADIYMIGHIHDQISRKIVEVGVDAAGTTIVHRDRLGAVSGGYLRTYMQGETGYGEVRGYAPTVLGAAVVRVCPSTRELRGEV